MEGQTESLGRQVSWRDGSLRLPVGEMLRPDRGPVLIRGQCVTGVRKHTLFEIRHRFAVLFQDGTLLGTVNTAFPLRERTRTFESEISRIVGELCSGRWARVGMDRLIVCRGLLETCDSAQWRAAALWRSVVRAGRPRWA